ncbi:hypothetical protein K1T71_007275 [Dendrolimus kikuchii]|uniref:Uncharacterized protein n=1 Tax=Dendrolimus kikuchii TaxID=765133 RepID=A0ACC1D079_9NEOP|nr:hypothetical protein K1T71_007275 [Dendrolimus kikuchii]
MKFLKMMSSSIFQIFSVLFFLAYLLGVFNIYFSDKTNHCTMTYMYEYPQFVRMSVPENNIYPQYGLYAYSEGRFTERARKMWFDGVPVLFLPGNSGSHMQARSLASVALRKALSKGYEYHFDFFSISYNEELSGLYGGVLESQTDFAAACISKILNLYKNNKFTKTVPSSVILIGHSMGGLIAKRLLTYPPTINTTSIAIALAAPLEAPVINFDVKMNDYYMWMHYEWEYFMRKNSEINNKKILLSFGNGPRDVLVPSGLTTSNDSYVNALTTSIPGVWVSPDHVCIVWCKQLVMAINRYLFSIIDPMMEQVIEDKNILMAKALMYFQANRSMTLNPVVNRAETTMLTEAFWYEDNRRIYQVTRPEIEKTTYLMIRLVKYPQNRFVAVEAVNVDDKDWIFGCNAKFTYHTYRYCKSAVSLSELSRWTGAATDFGKRKLATINLHNIKETYPDWSHVIVRVSPTRKPIVLNVDINDYASRQIFVDLPSDFSFQKHTIKHETEEDSLYYEFILQDFNAIHQAYLLYVEPTAGCKAIQYHVSAELHVPWAKNHEYYHYFTHLKRSPMKLRLFKSNPNITYGLEAMEHVKVTLLLDPQCTYTISISTSWYHRLAQLARNYTPTLVPYVTAIVLLVARANIMSLHKKGTCMSIHSALMSENVKPYYGLVFSRLAVVALTSLPFLSFIFESASWSNLEVQYFIRSLLVLPAYMTALGILNIGAGAILIAMVFSSQIAYTLFFRIVWRGGRGLAEKMATGLQKMPMVVSAALICAVPLSCGAASLTAGAAFYAFLLSKMYEEYLEDYVYKLMAKFASRICRTFKRGNIPRESEQSLVSKDSFKEKPLKTTGSQIKYDQVKNETIENKLNSNESQETNEVNNELQSEQNDSEEQKASKCDGVKDYSNKDDINEDLNNINFHMMMFFLWLSVAIVNVPALLTWARNFKYSMVLKPDTSYNTGLVMSVCSSCIWQMGAPRRNLRYYEAVSSLLFTMAVFIIALGPLSLTIVNYGVTFMFTVITMQQLFDKEKRNYVNQENTENTSNIETYSNNAESNGNVNDECNETRDNENSNATNDSHDVRTEVQEEQCDPCNENRIYNVFKRLRDKLSVDENVS